MLPLAQQLNVSRDWPCRRPSIPSRGICASGGASETWSLAGPVLVALLQQDLMLRRSKIEIAKLAEVLQGQSTNIAYSSAGVDVLDGAVRKVLNSHAVQSASEANVLLGESWFEHNDGRSSSNGEFTDAHRAVFAEQREQERRQLRAWLSQVWQVRSEREIAEWIEAVTDYSSDDLELRDAVNQVTANDQRKPAVVILGGLQRRQVQPGQATAG